MVENTVVLRPPRKGRTCVFGRVMGGFVERWLGVRICFSNRIHISVGNTGMFSPPMGGVCGAYSIRPYTCYMPYIKIRKRFSNREYVLVRDTGMFSPPMGGVCGAYAVAPLHVLHAIHRNMDMFSERGICFGWGYGHVFATNGWRSWGVCCCAPTRVTCHTSKYGNVFRTGNMFRLGIRPCFCHLRVAFVGRIQYAPTRVTCRTSKYGNVFQTGYIFRLGIRPCYLN